MKMQVLIDEKGSSSVLVVLTLLMLVLFGVLGMISSFSDYKIAQKNAAWTKDYYAFESIANEQLEKMDAAILVKKEEARVIFELWKAGKSFDAGVPKSVQRELAQMLSGIDVEDQAEIMIYSVLMKDWLNTFGESPIVEWSMDQSQLTLLYTVTIELENSRRYIVQVDLLPDSKDPYHVLMWREIPKTFDYSEGVEFEDVEVIGS